MRRKVNNSEIHETKRYYEVPSEKVQEWSDTIENLTKQRDQYKAERDTLNDKLNQSYEDNYKLEGQLHDITKKHDTLIDDLSCYKTKVSRLERENRFLLSRKDNLFDIWREENKRSVALSKRLEQLERENKDLRLQSDTYFEQWQQHKTLNNEFSQHIGNKPSSSTYKYFRGKLDGIGIKEDE